MTNPVFEREMKASEELRKRLRAEGVVQFDGDPHWERAIEALAQDAIKNGESARAAAPSSRTPD